MDLYAENILDHFRHPRNAGVPADANVTHHEANLNCGDTLTLSLHIENGMIAGIGWSGTGCAISQAAMSILSEELAGKKTEDVKALTPQHILELLGVPVGARRMKCALLSLHTLKNALRVYEKHPPQSWTETVGEMENA